MVESGQHAGADCRPESVGGSVSVESSASVEQPLGRALVFAAKEMREAFEHALTAAGGSLATWVVLNAVSVVGFVSQAALASHVHLEGATITHHVDRLEALDLVRRQVDPDDRRARRVELTPEGERLHAHLLTAVQELEQATLAGLAESDKVVLRRSLELISGNLQARKRAQAGLAGLGGRRPEKPGQNP